MKKLAENFETIGIFYFERHNTSKDFSFSFSKKFLYEFYFFGVIFLTFLKII